LGTLVVLGLLDRNAAAIIEYNMKFSDIQRKRPLVLRPYLTMVGARALGLKAAL
jgi:hypothetical protein